MSRKFRVYSLMQLSPAPFVWLHYCGHRGPIRILFYPPIRSRICPMGYSHQTNLFSSVFPVRHL